MHRLSLRFCSCVLLASAALCARTPAYAQDPPATGGSIEDDSRKADELFKQGKNAYTAGKLQEAHDAYLRAWQLKRSHDIASNLGNTELQLGLKRDAAEHLAYCVRNFPPTVDETKRQNTMRKFEAARADVGALSIKTNVRGAEVFVDGKSVGIAPLEAEIYADPGERVVEARLPEHEPAIVKVQVVKAGASGPAQEVVLALVPKVKRDGPLSGSGTQPPRKDEQPPPVMSTWRPGTALLVTGGVLAVGGLAAGAGLTAAANNQSGNADAIGARLGGPSTCTGAPPAAVALDCQNVKAALRSQSLLTDGARASFVIGGLFTLATAGAAIWAGLAPKQQKAGVHVVPLVGAREGGLTVLGAW
jgi:hypothetical protein